LLKEREPMLRRAATTCLQAIMLLSWTGITGCGPSAQEQQRAKAQEDFREAFVRRDVDPQSHEISHPDRVLVAQGHSPLIFDVREPAKAHVVDLTTGAEIASAEVGREQFVSVNEENGVLVGTRRVMPGPLPEGHEFGILLETSGEESFKTKIDAPAPPPRLTPIDLSPKPVPAPATRPTILHPFNTTTQPSPTGNDPGSNP
jgi:hypothetical protein